MGYIRIGIIGYGAIGQALHDVLRSHAAHARIVAILERAENAPAIRQRAGDAAVVSQWSDFLSTAPAAIVECAGHGALRAHGAAALDAGCDLIVSSIGALADPGIEAALITAAQRTGRRLVIPSGAVGGLDALASARAIGLDEVTYTGRKRPGAWKGTAAEGMIDLQNVTTPTEFFVGTAREAALTFSQNANVVAAIALAGTGFDRTRVTLIADPDTPGNRHDILARGPFGEISSSVLTFTLPANPKTSMLAPFSVLRAIQNLSGPMII